MLSLYIKCNFSRTISCHIFLMRLFIVNAEVHSYETRSSNKFHLPSVKTTFSKETCILVDLYYGIYFLKILSVAHHFILFKQNLKQYFIMYPCLRCFSLFISLPITFIPSIYCIHWYQDRKSVV